MRNIILGAALISTFNLIFWIGTFLLSLNVYYSSPKMNIIGNYMMGVSFTIGLTQLLYVIPLVFYLKWKRRYNLMKGVIIGACLTALINGSCWLVLFRPTFR